MDDRTFKPEEIIAAKDQRIEVLENVLAGKEHEQAVNTNNLLDRIEELEAEIKFASEAYLELKRLRKGEALGNLALQRKYEELEARIDKALKHLPERPGMAMGFLLEDDDE